VQIHTCTTLTTHAEHHHQGTKHELASWSLLCRCVVVLVLLWCCIIVVVIIVDVVIVVVIVIVI
jgi:hypothetical protein